MSRPWMPLYVADYLKDTGHLSAAEHGGYLLLIMHYWSTGSLPEADSKLARIARMTPAEWEDAKPTLAEFFGPDWTHARIDRELKEATEAYERRSGAGRKGGIAKAAAEAMAPCEASNARAMPENEDSNARALLKQSPSPSYKKDMDVGTHASDAGDAERIQFRRDLCDLYRDAGSMKFPDGRHADIWLERGFKPAICLAVVAEGLKRDPQRVPKYFDQPIADAHAAPAPRSGAPPGRERDQRSALMKAVAKIASEIDERNRTAQVFELIPSGPGAPTHGSGDWPDDKRHRA